jgi:hypothetical protein
VLTGWRRIGGGGNDREREWMREDRKSTQEGEQWIIAQEEEGK